MTRMHTVKRVNFRNWTISEVNIERPAGMTWAEAGNVAAKRVILIGCGKSKRSEASKAKDLYTGSLFKARREYAESQGCPWGIISAKHLFLAPDKVIEPYDTTMRQRLQEGMVPYSYALNVWQGAYRLAVGAIKADGTHRSGYLTEDGQERRKEMNDPGNPWPDYRGLTIEVHAGRDYVKPLIDLTTKLNEGEWTLDLPMKHLGQGKQLRWYKQLRMQLAFNFLFS